MDDPSVPQPNLLEILFEEANRKPGGPSVVEVMRRYEAYAQFIGDGSDKLKWRALELARYHESYEDIERQIERAHAYYDFISSCRSASEQSQPELPYLREALARAICEPGVIPRKASDVIDRAHSIERELKAFSGPLDMLGGYLTMAETITQTRDLSHNITVANELFAFATSRPASSGSQPEHRR